VVGLVGGWAVDVLLERVSGWISRLGTVPAQVAALPNRPKDTLLCLSACLQWLAWT
jgi:hypothetical protein